MPQIAVTIDGKTYRMACGDGEEEHLLALGAGLDERVTRLRGSFGEIGDLRLMVMAALMVADELDEARGRIAAAEGETAALRDREAQSAHGARAGDQRLTEHLLGVSEIVERIAAKLETGRL
ncbi:cell division protein ZapA [Aureimonas flava]|uniref:Cell division protein ZapA n=1 Tax=Aureimonas flava TaxID=2320271 RepID=A0A3A1WHV0_9HYPH|nr:cell division protein ZapA [Aureimonas flava]RIX98761.1 cell division protein ZapA [Aureimonas flava]